MTKTSSPDPRSSALYVGIDLGTSGCRAIAIDAQARIAGQTSLAWPAPEQQGSAVTQSAMIWWNTVQDLLAQLFSTISASKVAAICLDGTSGTVLLADEQGQPLCPALMYNDSRATAEAEQIRAVAPADSAVHSASSGLAKLLWLKQQDYADRVRYFLHQADWINGMLCGEFGVSDHNNALKSGYDPVQGCWPKWLDKLNVPRRWLPRVLPPGSPIGTIKPELASRFGLPTDTQVMAGTTDSTAAFLATGAHQSGDAVTSLGSTMVLKVVAEKPIFCAEYGVYSQPLGDGWLVGGASNSGGQVLRQYFSDAEMLALQEQLRPEQATGLDYYPLSRPGERFPYNDPELSPRLSPRPADRAVFFQAMLEGMARIEQSAYRRLAELGAPWPTTVRTVGGGAKNRAWTAIRGKLLNVPMLEPQYTEAAYGAALLAQQGKHS